MRTFLGLCLAGLTFTAPVFAETTIRSKWSSAGAIETSVVNAAGTPDKPNKHFKPRPYFAEVCYDRGEPETITVHVDGKGASSSWAKNACVILQGQYDIIVETDQIYDDKAAPAGYIQVILPSQAVAQKTTKTITRRLLEKAKPSED